LHRENCCSLCGVNHQARDLMRAVLLHLVDQIEENVKFVGFLHDNQFVTEEAYQAIANRITTNHNELIQEERKKTCHHLTAETSPITPGTSGCADCEKEGIMDWIGLRLCTICGHVGCDDSSKGMHATKHCVNTGHAVIVALPDRTWKWCYIDKLYG
jgi:uncharacterized UBP type Zn finger protein